MLKTTPLHGRVPDDCAQWMDAWSVASDGEVGSPGYDALRKAWIGKAPVALAEETLDEWLEEQARHQRDAQSMYEQLVATEPLPSYDEETGEADRPIPEWFLAKWTEVLLTRPWDEKLGNAVESARTYLAART